MSEQVILVLLGLLGSLIGTLAMVVKVLLSARRIEEHVNGLDLDGAGKKPTLGRKVAEIAARTLQIEGQISDHISWEVEYRNEQDQKIDALAQRFLEYDERNEQAHEQIRVQLATICPKPQAKAKRK